MSVPSYDSVEVGTELPPLSVTLTRADLVRYAAGSGDLNRIHWDERFATSVGLPDVIAHGMLTMGQSVRVVTEWCGDPGAVLEYGVRFTKPVVVPYEQGARLDVTAVVATKDDQARTVRVDLTATASDPADPDAAPVKVLGRAQAVVRLG